MAEKEVVIRQFRDGRNSFWVNLKAVNLTEDKQIIYASGGDLNELELKKFKEYLRRKKLI